MFFLRSHYRHPVFRQGALDSMTVAPGIAAWGLMTGVAMMNSGMSMAEALLMSLTVFAGSSQLAAIPLLSAGAPMLPPMSPLHPRRQTAVTYRKLRLGGAVPAGGVP